MLHDLMVQLGNNLVSVLAAILMSAATVAVTRVAAWVKMRTGIELTESDEKRVRDIVSDAVHYAEEQGYKAVKTGADKYGSEDKLKAAVAYVQAATKGGLTQDEIEKRLHAEVSRMRTTKAASAAPTAPAQQEKTP